MADSNQGMMSIKRFYFWLINNQTGLKSLAGLGLNAKSHSSVASDMSAFKSKCKKMYKLKIETLL